MKIIVIGAGFTGMQLARSLIADGHRIVLIDRSADRVQEASAQLDCVVLHSHGNSLEILEEGGIASADALVAVTDSDEVNIVACSLTDAVYPKVLKIARVRNYAYYQHAQGVTRKVGGRAEGKRRSLFGIDWMINPDVEVARAISRTLEQRALGGVLKLGSGYGILTLSIGAASPLKDLPLKRLREVEGWHYLVAYVADRAGGNSLPNADTVLHVGSQIGVLAHSDELQAVASFCDAAMSESVRIVLIGAGRIASQVIAAQRGSVEPEAGGHPCGWRNRMKVDLAVVDESAERCHGLVEQFRNVRVFCGDVTDAALLAEERFDLCDLAIAASDSYDRNLIAAAYLKSRGVEHSIALTAHAELSGLAAQFGIDVAIPMRETVIDSILSHLYGHNVISVHTVCNGAFMLVECRVAKGSKVAGKALGRLGLSGSALVLMVQGADTPEDHVPDGDTVLSAGDRIVLIVPAGDFNVVRMITE